MQNGNEMESFRSDVKAWVIENFPASLRGVDLAGIAGGEIGAKACLLYTSDAADE